jgi:hypothetical protein
MQIIPKEHKKMIRAIQNLPEFPKSFFPKTNAQVWALMNQMAKWKYLGAKIDHLQKKQLGFLPAEPIPKSLHPLLQEQLHVIAEYLFWLLQVLIEGFDDVKNFASQRQRNFPFTEPRELFVGICTEFSSMEIAPIVSDDVGVGETLTEVRVSQSLTGKFFRFSLTPEKEAQLCSSLEETGFYYGLAIAAIYSTSKTYLKKLTNKRGQTWKQFRNAHKAMNNFCNKQYKGDGSLCTITWNAGHPVFSQNGKPVDFPPFHNPS